MGGAFNGNPSSFNKDSSRIVYEATLASLYLASKFLGVLRGRFGTRKIDMGRGRCLIIKVTSPMNVGISYEK